MNQYLKSFFYFLFWSIVAFFPVMYGISILDYYLMPSLNNYTLFICGFLVVIMFWKFNSNTVKDYNKFSIKIKLTLIGLIVGTILGAINYFSLGLFGFFFFIPFDFLFDLFNICSGEGCWGHMIMVGSMGYLIFVPLIFYFIGYKLEKRKISN